MDESIIIFDWDDTLFPSSYIQENNIKLDNMNDFIYLDELIESILIHIHKFGKIIIITNGSLKWILFCLNILPKTKNFIKNHVVIISARDRYSHSYDVDYWKRLSFQDALKKYYNKKIKNIISIGDAEYELNALANLHSLDPKLILKSIKLIRSPSYDDLIAQLILFKKNIMIICLKKSHIDVKFHPTN